ncbi:MAG: sodium:solute symporter family protein [Clostridiaceae bacterium]|nr:sodium:solute symporter family protein [Clostridiaceae bacterium]
MQYPVITIILVYIIGSTVIGLFLSRGNKTVQSYFISKEQLPLWITVPYLFSCCFAGSYTAGNVAGSYSSGFSAAFPIACMGLGVLFFLPLIPVYRGFAAKGYLSVPEVFRARFDNQSRNVLLILNTMLYAAFFAVQPTVMAGIVAPIFHIDPLMASWICTFLFIIMTLSGLTGLAWMNLFHALFMLTGLFMVAAAAVGSVGGLQALQAAVPASYFNLSGLNWHTMVGYVISIGIAMFASSSVPTAVTGSKTAAVARRTCIIVGLLIIPFTFMVSLIGIAAQVALPDLQVKSMALYIMASRFGPLFSIAASTAILAAILSSAPAYLLFCATGITRDIYLRAKPDATQKQQINISRLVIIVLALLCNLLAQRASSVLNVIFGFSQIQSICGVVLLISIFWKRVDGRAAFWSMTAGGTLSAIWYFLGSPFGILPAWLSLIPGLSILCFLTLTSKKKIADGYLLMREAITATKETREAAKTPKAAESEPEATAYER